MRVDVGPHGTTEYNILILQQYMHFPSADCGSLFLACNMWPCRAISTLPRAAQRRLLSPWTDSWRRGISFASTRAPSRGRLLPTIPLSRRRQHLTISSSIPQTHCTPSRRRRAFSSYDWKNMSKYAKQANADFAKLTPQEIRTAGEEEVDKVEKALKSMEPFNDVFTVRREGLEIFAELGPEVGTYWIKFDLSIQQICMMSPRSGPHRYIYDKSSGRWIGEADKHDFQGMLTRDIIQSACGVPDF